VNVEELEKRNEEIEPLELLERLAAMTPRPEPNLLRRRRAHRHGASRQGDAKIAPSFVADLVHFADRLRAEQQ
jgi:hypothetical protein